MKQFKVGYIVVYREYNFSYLNPKSVHIDQSPKLLFGLLVLLLA